jgi:hypothetical protein
MNSTEIGRVTSSDGTSIAFERVGAGPAVILVDAAGNFRGFSPMPQLAEALAQNFTIFTYDRRGKGASTDTLPYAVDREIDDLQALIDVAGGSAFVHGFSSGRCSRCSRVRGAGHESTCCPRGPGHAGAGLRPAYAREPGRSNIKTTLRTQAAATRQYCVCSGRARIFCSYTERCRQDATAKGR